jgi:hypothetical protein
MAFNLEAQASPSSSQALRRKGDKLSGVKETSSPPHDADVSEGLGAADDNTDKPPIRRDGLSTGEGAFRAPAQPTVL